MANRFNLNDRVRFKLTALGEKTPAHLFEPDEDGSRECPLWALMHAIGPDMQMQMGANLIVNNNLELVRDFLDKAIDDLVLKTLKLAAERIKELHAGDAEMEHFDTIRRVIKLAEGRA